MTSEIELTGCTTADQATRLGARGVTIARHEGRRGLFGKGPDVELTIDDASGEILQSRLIDDRPAIVRYPARFFGFFHVAFLIYVWYPARIGFIRWNAERRFRKIMRNFARDIGESLLKQKQALFEPALRAALHNAAKHCGGAFGGEGKR